MRAERIADPTIQVDKVDLQVAEPGVHPIAQVLIALVGQLRAIGSLEVAEAENLGEVNIVSAHRQRHERDVVARDVWLHLKALGVQNATVILNDVEDVWDDGTRAGSEDHRRLRLRDEL